MRDHKCWNDDINSLELYQAQQRWVAGQGGDDRHRRLRRHEVRQEGRRREGRGHGRCPSGATGPYAGKLGSTSQTVGITAWTKYPKEAADFIMFMHTPERMAAWFKTTGAFPADDRFNTKLITLPQQKLLFDLVKKGSPYLENFIPPSSTRRRCSRQSQLLLGGNIDASEGSGRDREDRAAHPPDAAEADGELQEVGGVVPLVERTSSAVPDVE